MRSTNFVFLLAATFLTIQSHAQTQTLMTSDAWESFLHNFIEAYFSYHPDFAVYQGRHEFDGKFPDWTPEGFRRQSAWLKERRTAALNFKAGLSEAESFERDYLIAVIDKDLFWLEKAESPSRNPTFYNLDPTVYVSRPYASLEVRLKAYTSYAKGIPSAAEQIRKNLRTPLPRTFVDIGRITFGGLASYYQNDVPEVFKSVKDQVLQAEFRSANNKAIEAMKALDSWFEGQKAVATDGFSMGPKLFSEMLYATERVDVSLDELERIGKKDLERNLAALREACAAYAPGKSVEECIRLVNLKKPIGGPVQGARRQLAGLRDFIV